MGYRTFIGSLNRIQYNKIKYFNTEEFCKYKNDDDLCSVSKIVDKELFELGKYVEEFPKEYLQPVFLDKDLQNEYIEEHDLFIVDKDFLKFMINNYNIKIQKIYHNMIQPFKDNNKFLKSVKLDHKNDDDELYTFDFNTITRKQQTALFNMISHVKSFKNEWDHLYPYDLENGDSITKSWKYEYEIFELVRIYKTFDWINNVMVYYGY